MLCESDDIVVVLDSDHIVQHWFAKQHNKLTDTERTYLQNIRRWTSRDRHKYQDIIREAAIELQAISENIRHFLG